MESVFVSGALCQGTILSEVLGYAHSPEPARLADFTIYQDNRSPFPDSALCKTPGAAAEGWLLRDVPQSALDRLTVWHGSDLKAVHILMPDGSECTALAPASGCPPQECSALWDAGAWAADWLSLAERTAHGVMALYEREGAARAAELRAFIAARAWAQRLATGGAPHALRSGMSLKDVQITREKPGFQGFFGLRAFEIRHRTFEGGWSETVGREGFVAYDAALVLPYDPATDGVLLIEQLRYGPVLRGDPHPWVLEPVAGLVDAGESPEACVMREAREEAGLTLRELRPMVRVYASPGYTSEFFHCFLGLCDLENHDAGLHGLDEEHEDIRSHILPFDDAMALVDSGEINAGPLAMMLYWLARHREALRGGA